MAAADPVAAVEGGSGSGPRWRWRGGAGSGGSVGTAENSTCRILQYAALDIVAEHCFTREGTAYVSTGTVHVNGLTIESKKISFDPVKRSVHSEGPVDLSIGQLKFFHGPIDWKLPAGNTLDLGQFQMDSFGGKLYGFPLKGGADVKLVRGAIEIPVTVGLPSVLGGVTAQVTVRADNLAGVHARELTLAVGDAPLGPLELKKVSFSYDPENDSWSGGGNADPASTAAGPVVDGQHRVLPR